MIAAENFVPRAVLQAQGSVLTNKYAEGCPAAATTAAARTSTWWRTSPATGPSALFGADFANVQPHSGSRPTGCLLGDADDPGEAAG